MIFSKALSERYFPVLSLQFTAEPTSAAVMRQSQTPNRPQLNLVIFMGSIRLTSTSLQVKQFNCTQKETDALRKNMTNIAGCMASFGISVSSIMSIQI